MLTWVLIGLVVALVDTAVGSLGHGWLAETLAQALSITLVTPFAALVGVLRYLDRGARRGSRAATGPDRGPGASGT